MLGSDVAGGGNAIPGCALELEVVPDFIDCVWADAILIGGLQFE
jgi:hypothetical protein